MAHYGFNKEGLEPMCHHRKCDGSECLFEGQMDYNEPTSLSRLWVGGIREEFRKEPNSRLTTRMNMFIEQMYSNVISGNYPDELNEEYTFEDIDSGKSEKIQNYCLSKCIGSVNGGVEKYGYSSPKKGERLNTESDLLSEFLKDTLQYEGILNEKNVAKQSIDDGDVQLRHDGPSSSLDETLPLKPSAKVIIAKNPSEWKLKRKKIFDESTKRLKVSTSLLSHHGPGPLKPSSTKASSTSLFGCKPKYADGRAKQPSPSINIDSEGTRRTASKVIPQAVPSTSQETARLAIVPPALVNKRGISWNEIPEKSLITPLKGCLSPVKRKNDETGTLTSLSCSLHHLKCLKRLKTSSHTSTSMLKSRTKVQKSSPPKIQDETSKIEVWKPKKTKKFNWDCAPATMSSVSQNGKLSTSRHKDKTVSTKRTSRVEVSLWLQKCSSTQVSEPYAHDSVLSETSFMQRKRKIKW